MSTKQLSFLTESFQRKRRYVRCQKSGKAKHGAFKQQEAEAKLKSETALSIFLLATTALEFLAHCHVSVYSYPRGIGATQKPEVVFH